MSQVEKKRIAIVGAGVMGLGIGQRFAQAGHQVVLHDLSKPNLAKALDNIKHNLKEMAELNALKEGPVQSVLDRIRTTTELSAAASDADLVVEAVFEDLELKQGLFKELDGLCPEKTILASNSASLMPSQLGALTKRKDRVLVAHYFYPPHLIPLVELVRSEDTSKLTLETYYQLAQDAGSIPVVINKEATGFLVNRLQFALFREVFDLVERGIASPQDIDLAVKNSFGPRLAVAGPVEIMEVQAGWKLVRDEARHVLPDLSTSRGFPKVLDDEIAQGRLGAVTGQGFYKWPPEVQRTWKRKMSENLVARFLGG
ncbi:MAG: 3-hydroxyacyl-CoA dehydrogenase family protein [Deltaproteobacteria bacterium]|nr:3-hydroxyacyl-CoA dehydrogenase family protein [Deltaproteobacteria bacterium]